MKLLGNTEDITVTQEAYGVIRTKFNLCDRYQVGDNIRMDLYYDIVSHKVCDLYIYRANSIEGDIAEVVVSLMDYMEAGFEESRDEVLEAVSEKTVDIITKRIKKILIMPDIIVINLSAIFM